MPSSLYIGLMSGTSLDGVDAVLATIDAEGTRVLHHVHHPFPKALRLVLASLCSPGENEILRLGQAEQQLTQQYYAAVQALLNVASCPAQDVQAIGCHGQTLRHHPELGFSLQAGNPGALAALTQIPVVADFRRADIALGGEGAPLVPQFHLHQFAHPTHNKAVLNLGGIANVSILNGQTLTIGFDTGPANTLLDQWCHQHTGRMYDKNGEWGRTGTLLPHLLEALLADTYFSRPAPKSTGREYFNLPWLQAHLTGEEDPADVQHTLTHLTAQSVANAIAPYTIDELVVCGGGARNSLLMELLSQALPRIQICTSETYHLPVDQVEAAAFAWLAWARMHGVTGNAPQATGARKALVLGGLYLG